MTDIVSFLVQGWEELMGEVAEVEAVLAIDCPEDVLIGACVACLRVCVHVGGCGMG